MGNGVVLIVLTMETSKPKDGDTTDNYVERLLSTEDSFVHPAPGGITTESPYGTGQFNGKRKRY